MRNITVVVPTFDRLELLERTLLSISACRFPRNLRKVIIAENGKKVGTDKLVAVFQEQFPFEYRFIPAANKSAALNKVLEEPAIDDDFIIFFDDDIRVHADTLLTYSAAAERFPKSKFYCGKVHPDFEEEPAVWLKSYLPASVIGFDLGNVNVDMREPDALGANWAAFNSDIHAVGGFSETFGPGTFARGQESDMQSRLISTGGYGTYLPNAVVWHFVPKERCSPEWARNRAKQIGTAQGLNRRSLITHKKLWLITKIWTRYQRLLITQKIVATLVSSECHFALSYKANWNRGFLDGLTASEIKTNRH